MHELWCYYYAALNSFALAFTQEMVILDLSQEYIVILKMLQL